MATPPLFNLMPRPRTVCVRLLCVVLLTVRNHNHIPSWLASLSRKYYNLSLMSWITGAISAPFHSFHLSCGERGCPAKQGDGYSRGEEPSRRRKCVVLDVNYYACRPSHFPLDEECCLCASHFFFLCYFSCLTK